MPHLDSKHRSRTQSNNLAHSRAIPFTPTQLAVATALLISLVTPAFAQYDRYGRPLPAGGAANPHAVTPNGDNAYNQAHVYPHQDQHMMQNPAFFSIGAVGVSNSVDPGFVQGTLGQVEAAAGGAGGAGGRTAVVIYYDQNPYSAGGTAQNQQNFNTYQQSLQNAPGAGYLGTPSADGITYLAKPTAGSDASLAQTFSANMPASLVFQAAKVNSNGMGAVVGQVTVDANSVAHMASLSQVAGSNLYLNFARGNQYGGMNSYIGSVAFNQQYNHDATLDLSNYAGYQTAANQALGQSNQSGNESGFYLTPGGSQQWGGGDANSINAPYNPFATLHAHTHPGGGSMPSITDMISSAVLGIPGAVIGANGQSTSYGFTQIGGVWQDPRGGVGFEECGRTRTCGSDGTSIFISGNYVMPNNNAMIVSGLNQATHGEIHVSNGYTGTTNYEAGPGTMGVTGNLTGRDRNSGYNTGDGYRFRLPSNLSLGSIANQINNAANSYNNGLPYSYPSPWNGNSLGDSDRYNSNSYIAGLLYAVNPNLYASIINAMNANRIVAPGIQNPIPLPLQNTPKPPTAPKPPKSTGSSSKPPPPPKPDSSGVQVNGVPNVTVIHSPTVPPTQPPNSIVVSPLPPPPPAPKPPPPPPPSSSPNSRVICTHFYRKGMMARDVWLADLEYTAKYLPASMVCGYHLWAIPYVKLMRKSPLAEKIMYPIAIWRAEELAYKMGILNKGNWKGKVVRLVLEPICWVLGQFTKEQDWHALWATTPLANKERRNVKY